MTVKELIDALGNLPQHAPVYLYNALSDTDAEVCEVRFEPGDVLRNIPCAVTMYTAE